MRSGFKAWTYLLATVALLAAVPAAAGAQAGRLDLTFGERGRASTPLNITDKAFGAAELGIAPDGSAVLAERGALVRFLPNGSPDRGFGRGGKLFLGQDTAAEGVAERTFTAGEMDVDGRGRIVVFGEQADMRGEFQPPGSNPAVGATSAVVLRFRADGRPDRGFGGGKGFIREDFGLESELTTEIPLVNAMTGRVDSQDRPVLVAGVASTVSGCYSKSVVRYQPRALVRLTDSGLPDPSFGGGDGVSPLEGSASFPRLEIDRANRAVVEVGRIGGYQANCRPGTALLRFGRQGERLGFGANGIRELGKGNLDLIDRAGATIVSHGQGRAVIVIRLETDGSRDPSFAGSGSARVALPPRAHVSPVAVDRRGRILLAGFIGSGGRRSTEERPRISSFAVTRLLANGNPDHTFGDHGWIITPVARPLRLTSATGALDFKGRLLVAGTVVAPGHPRGGFILARYLLGA